MSGLYEIQQNLKAPKNQRNDFGKYNYRSCEDILEAVKPLMDEGTSLILSDTMVDVGGRVYVKATARLITQSGTFEAHGWAREAENKKGMDDAQITGAASSYARKYALNGLFCIDDTKDADATNQHSKAKHEYTKPTNKPQQDATQKAVSKAKEIKQLFDEATDKTQVLDDYVKEITWIKKNCPEAYKIIEDIA